MTDGEFNPFEDRFSRDLRNELSSGFADAVETGSKRLLDSTVDKFAKMQLALHYRNYLEDRCSRYHSSLKEIAASQHPLYKAAILWNHGLYFEVHEVLEHSWYSAEGAEKRTMQALIRAAGVYIKLHSGFVDAAVKIAAKAWPVLEENKHLLRPYFAPEALISALQDTTAPPPTLQLNEGEEKP